MELGLKDKVAIITGASRGIGAASAKALAYHGASVIINYVQSKDKAEAVLEEIKNCGGKGMIYQADVRDLEAVNAMVNSATGEFGKIDILVNNANINFPVKPFTEGFAAHAAAKSAVDGMAKVMAMEMGPSGITVNVIGPGLVLTDATSGQPKEMHEQLAAITPLRRLGMPEDIAGVVVFLASSLSGYLNGEYIPVNGGSFMI